MLGLGIFTRIKLLLVLLVKIVDRVPKCRSVDDVVLVRRQQLLEYILVFLQDVHDEKIRVFLVHRGIVFAVVSESTRAILILEDFVGLSVAKKLLEESQNPGFGNRLILKDTANLHLCGRGATQLPCSGGLKKVRIRSTIR